MLLGSSAVSPPLALLGLRSVSPPPALLGSSSVSPPCLPAHLPVLQVSTSRPSSGSLLHESSGGVPGSSFRSPPHSLSTLAPVRSRLPRRSRLRGLSASVASTLKGETHTHSPLAPASSSALTPTPTIVHTSSSHTLSARSDDASQAEIAAPWTSPAHSPAHSHIVTASDLPPSQPSQVSQASHACSRQQPSSAQKGQKSRRDLEFGEKHFCWREWRCRCVGSVAPCPLAPPCRPPFSPVGASAKQPQGQASSPIAADGRPRAAHRRSAGRLRQAARAAGR